MVCNYSNTIAIKYGINSALIAGFINYRLTHTDTKFEGRPFVRITQKSLTATFPFMGEKAVRNAIKRLVKANIITVKQFRKSKFDHANFYALTQYGKTLMEGVEDIE